MQKVSAKMARPKILNVSTLENTFKTGRTVPASCTFTGAPRTRIVCSRQNIIRTLAMRPNVA